MFVPCKVYWQIKVVFWFSFSLLVLIDSFWRLNKVGVSKSHYPIFHPQITQIIQIFFKYNMYNNLRHQRHLRMKCVLRHTVRYV